MNLKPLLPSSIAHADWGSDEKKRCVAVAYRREGAYHIDVPSAVSRPKDLLPSLLREASGGCVMAGFDFPIGLPRAYAHVASITSFLSFLRALGRPPWSNFYRVCRHPEDVSIARPFYPYRPGGTRQAHLTQGLGIPSMRSLLRRCEQGYESRGDACPLFWTLGPNQVGKAAISGWSEVVQPAVLEPEGRTKIWPFDGDLPDLLQPGICVIAETYPAEACTHLGLTAPGTGWSKRSQADRRERALRVTADAAAHGVMISPDLRAVCKDGFGEGPDGEDSFDALIGLLAMIEIVHERRSPGVPDEPVVRNVEGWILGQLPSRWS